MTGGPRHAGPQKGEGNLKSSRRPGGTTAKWTVAVLTVAALSLLAVVAAVGARAAGGPPTITAGPMRGIVPPRNLAHGNASGSSNLIYHGGPVQNSGTTVYPIYWGPSWTSSFSATESGLNGAFYGKVGGTSYAKTNTEYTNSSGQTVSASVSFGGSHNDTSKAPKGSPSTMTVLREVANATGGSVHAGWYYPVYSDQPRGGAGYCAWHSAGTINGIEVQFGFFFSLKNDSGCPNPSTISNEQLGALGHVSGHELSEQMTDPQLNAWYDASGAE